MNTFKYLCSLLLGLYVHTASGQNLIQTTLETADINKDNVLTDIYSQNLAPLFTQAPEQVVLGFIGKEYQRIRVKFLSVIKNHDELEKYLIYGKTMVHGNICDFQGELTLTGAYRQKKRVNGQSTGILVGLYKFYENPDQQHVGIFEGEFVNSWYLEKDGSIHYNDLEMGMDGYHNNQFSGTWTMYGEEIPAKACNWGDYRIPFPGDLDDGAGEFIPAPAYHKNGWKSYMDAHFLHTPEEGLNHSKTESEKWW